jgi:hypothetical protein
MVQEVVIRCKDPRPCLDMAIAGMRDYLGRILRRLDAIDPGIAATPTGKPTTAVP